MTVLLAHWSLIPPNVEHPVLFFVLASAAMILMAMAKTGFAGSVGLLSVPVMIYACGGNAALATGVMLPVLVVCDYVALLSWWGQWDRGIVLRLLPGTLAGVAGVWGLLWSVRQTGAARQSAMLNASLTLMIGLIALAFVVLQTIRALRKKTLTVHPGPVASTAVGFAAGTTSTFAHAAGPVTSIYLLSQNMPKGRFVATSVLFYWILNQVKLLPYVHLDMIDLSSLGVSLALVPAVVVGAILGVVLHRKVGQKQFTGIVYVLLALAGVHLCIKAGKMFYDLHAAGH